MKTLSLLLLFFLLKNCRAFNKLLLGTTDVNCSATSSIGPNAVIEMFFKKQNTIVMLDFSVIKLISSEICAKGKISRAFEVFNEHFNKNLSTKHSKRGLFEYPTTFGLYVKGTFGAAINILPVIAKTNPRVKLLFQLTDGDYAKAEKILRDGFHVHKMLEVGVMMSHHQRTMTFCSYNPFAGDINFKCWNMTARDYKHSLPSIDDFIDKRIKNLQKYPLKIAIFENPNQVSSVKNKKGNITHYEYPDGDLIHQISIQMNFTPIYFHPGGDIRQGKQLTNGSFSGSLGTIESGVADYSANSLLVSASYNTSNVIFVSPMEMEKFVFVIRNDKVSNDLGIYMFSEFDKTTSFILLALIFIYPALYTIIAKLESKLLQTQKQVVFVKSVFYIAAIQLNISMRHLKLNASRLVIAAVLFHALIMTSIFQGTFVSNLSNNQDNGRCKSMDELIENDYRLLIHSDAKEVLVALGGKWLEITSKPNSTMINTQAGYTALRAHPKVAFLGVRFGNHLDRAYDPKTGENYFYEVPEVVFEFYQSPIIPKNSPFIERFKEIMMRYIEYGLSIHQMKVKTFNNDKFIIQRLISGFVPKVKDKTIEMDDLWAILKLYLLFNGFAFLIFLTEISYRFALKLKHKFSRPPSPPPFDFVL